MLEINSVLLFVLVCAPLVATSAYSRLNELGHCHSYGPPCHPGVPHKHLCEDETPQNNSVERSEGEPALDLCFAELMALSSRLESTLPCLSKKTLFMYSTICELCPINVHNVEKYVYF